MSEKKRRLQFGLRKLLLWTAVVALFLGFLRMVELGPILCVSVLCWAVMIRSLRTVFGLTVVAVVAVLSGAVLTAFRFCLPPLAVNWLEATLLAAALGGVYGFAVFAFSEVAALAIDSLDSHMETKTDRDRETETPEP